MVSMTGHTTFFDLVTLYIDIVPSNLTASINGETNDVTGSSEMEFNFNQVLTLNALDFSTDPDVDPDADLLIGVVFQLSEACLNFIETELTAVDADRAFLGDA